jgi:large repetitive protein
VTVEELPDLAPVITAFEEPNDTIRYTPGHPISLTGEFEVEDADDDSLEIAEIGFVSQHYAAGSDRLLFVDMARIKGQFDPITGVLSLRGRAPIEEYITAVRSVQYNFTGNDESKNHIKRIYFRLSDGNSFSELKERVIRVSSALIDLDIPTAFTPNSDGANDTWRILAPGDISGSDFADAEVRVYDKRGTVVYGEKGLANTWDGTYQGKLLPVDTYYYTIDLKQKQKRYRGVVAILR